MTQSWHAEEMLLLLSALAGAVHVMAPDHWIPSSLLTWQRRWSPIATFGFVGAALMLHSCLGFAIYLALAHALEWIPIHRFFAFAVAWVVVGAGLRALRFPQIREVLRVGTRPVRGTLACFLFLGPSESIVPIFLKARHLGVGYLSPFFAFASGTLVMGAALVFVGHRLWNSPLLLARSIQWADQRRTLVPIVTMVSLGLVLLLRLH